MSERIFRSSEIAAYCAVSKKAIRHYKKLGLLEPSYIDNNNYWYFNIESVERLNLIQKLKRLNLSLEEIKDFFMKDHNTQLRMITRRMEALEESLRELEDSISLADQILALEGDSFVEKISKIEKKDHDEWIAQQTDKTMAHLHEIYAKEKHAKEHHKIIEILKDIKIHLDRGYKEQLTEAFFELDELFAIHFDDSKKRCEVMKLHVEMLSNHNLMIGIYMDEEIEKLKIKIDEFYIGNSERDLVRDM